MLTPLLLFTLLMALLYVPPVQNWLCREASAYASRATGMQISVARIDLRFPLNLLVTGAQVIQSPDTLLYMESLNVRVQALPLLKGRVEADAVTLKRVNINSAHLIKGMQIKGFLGRFSLRSHGVDLKQEIAIIDRAELSDTHLHIITDTVAIPKDTASTPIDWTIALQRLKLKNVSFSLQPMGDYDKRTAIYLGEAEANNARADLRKQAYSLQHLRVSGSTARYSDYMVHHIGIEADSLSVDTTHIHVPRLQLKADHGLEMHVAARVSPKEVQLSRLTARIPGVFSLQGEGTMVNPLDSLTRNGMFQLGMATQQLNTLAKQMDIPVDSSFVIPDNMSLRGLFRLHGARLSTQLRLKQGQGNVLVDATLNTFTQAYTAKLKATDLQLHDIFPKDSIYKVSFSANLKGQGFDVKSPRSQAAFNFAFDSLHYSRYHLAGISVTGNLQSALANVNFTVDNALAKMSVDAECNLKHRYFEGSLTADIARIDFYRLGLTPRPIRRQLPFRLTGEVEKEHLFVQFAAGDLKAELNARTGLIPFADCSIRFAEVLTRQLKAKLLNHAKLRQAMPSAIFAFSAGKENPLSYYLATHNISFNDAYMNFGVSPDRGINGRAVVHTLRIDTLQLDTIFFAARQDTTLMNLRAGIINGAKNPHFHFSTRLTGEIRDSDADLLAEYKNAKGKTGVLLGVNASPLGEQGGVAFKLIPEQPILAFRKFHFNEDNNRVHLQRNMYVDVDVEMIDDEGMGFRIHSVPDSTSLQNIDVEIRRVRLDEITAVLPYFPHISGLLSAEASYVQRAKANLQLSAEATIKALTYEKKRIGDVSLAATWLPGEHGKQYINGYLTHDKKEVMAADGKLIPIRAGRDSMEVNLTLEQFPLRIADVFLPEKLISLRGNMDGGVSVTGTLDKPMVNGDLVMDSVTLTSRLYSAHFMLDKQPLQLRNNRLLLNKYAIYTTSNNPFTVDGVIDFRDTSHPTANLSLLAKNYEILRAKRTRESLLYGRVYADLNATVKGVLSELKMRGNINLLGSTDVSYILVDSPITVQDRLGSLVSFTSFRDTTTVVRRQTPTVSLGGLDMLMTIHIDPAVRVKVDFDTSNDNSVELEGGGDLSMRYTPQGDLSLTGRYTLSGGQMKYSLPVVAAKSFSIVNGSHVEWTGNPMDPLLSFKASNRVRASVPDDDSNGGTHPVNFDISIIAKNRLNELSFAFDVDAQEDATVQNELNAMDADGRAKQALYIMLTKTYLGHNAIGSGSSNSKLDMGSAINTVLSSQINELMGNIKGASISVGVDNAFTDTGRHTDYSFSYSQRFFNNRFRVVVGGKVSTGADAVNNAETFIDNVSLEYRLDQSGTRYVRVFYDNDRQIALEGEVMEAGVGLVLRKKIDTFSELFIFKNKK